MRTMQESFDVECMKLERAAEIAQRLASDNLNEGHADQDDVSLVAFAVEEVVRRIGALRDHWDGQVPQRT